MSGDWSKKPFFFINSNGIRLVMDFTVSRPISNDCHEFSIKELQDKLSELYLLL
jgi:hypothetical protein